MWLLSESRGGSTRYPAPRCIRGLGVGVRVCSYHDALPRQILVHKDVVGWETPKKTEVRYFVHIALEP